MSLPFTSLDAATQPGPGAARDLEGVYARHSYIAVVAEKAPETTVPVWLEGSHDGDTWVPLAMGYYNNGNVSAGQPVSGDTADMSPLVRYVRANWSIGGNGGSEFPGGPIRPPSASGVTVTIASDIDNEED